MKATSQSNAYGHLSGARDHQTNVLWVGAQDLTQILPFSDASSHCLRISMPLPSPFLLHLPLTLKETWGPCFKEKGEHDVDERVH